jgi:outer membrane immunogenic protein
VKTILSGMLAGGAIVAAGSAIAADLYTKGPITAPAPSFSWTRCYAGGQIGLGAGHTWWTDSDTPGAIDGHGFGNTATTDRSGGEYGGQLGCDYQFGGWVLGLQGMMAASTIAGTNQDQFNPSWTLGDQLDWFGSVTGRFGTTIADRTLLYARGGAAWAHNRFEIESRGFNLGTPSATQVGWTLGTGIEYAFNPSWSVFVEADYYSFGNHNVGFIGNPAAGNASFHVNTTQSIATLQFGVNYHFFTR